jgi:NADPH:quinone reductase
MRAVMCREFGPPSSLTVEDIEPPVAGPGEVVVAIKAAGLNFYDTLIIRDRYQYKAPMPFSPGGELAGMVTGVGAGVDDAWIGRRVIAYTKWNACREAVAVAVADLIELPDAVAYELGAAIIVTYGTTIHALKDRAGLKPGETLAILGASGGVGQAAIEIGKLMGARVIACASSDDKLAFCRQMGADEAVNYDAVDLKAELRRLTGGRGVDVIYDAVGDKYSEPALRASAWGGRHLVVGFAAGEIPKIPLNLLLLKGCDLRGVFWGESLTHNPAGHVANMKDCLQWIADGKLTPHIHHRYTLDETAAALDALASRQVKGKAVVMP